MKKALILLLVGAMMLCVCSCSSAKNDTNTTTKTQPETTTLSEEEQVLETLGEFIDIDAYSDIDFFEEGEKDFRISLEKKTYYNFDGTITLFDGDKITLPITYQDIKKSGWSLAPEDEVDTIGGKEDAETVNTPEGPSIETSGEVRSIGNGLVNEKGEEIYVSLTNNSEYATPIDDCIIYSITLGEEAALSSFSLPNGVSDKSSYSDVVSKIGLPNEIDYYITEENGTEFYFTYYSADKSKKVAFESSGAEDMSYYSRISFTFTETGKMTGLEYTIYDI